MSFSSTDQQLERKDRGIIEISIKDTGIWILEGDIGRIFEPFYRGRNGISVPWWRGENLLVEAESFPWPLTQEIVTEEIGCFNQSLSVPRYLWIFRQKEWRRILVDRVLHFMEPVYSLELNPSGTRPLDWTVSLKV